MKKLAVILIYSFMILGNIKSFAQRVEKILDVKDFTGIDCNIAAEVTIEKSDTFFVKIDAPEDIMARLETTVKDSLLRFTIRKARGFVNDARKAIIKVHMPQLDYVALNGYGNVYSKADWKGEKLRVFIDGAGNIKLKNIDFNTVIAEQNGAGEIILEGAANNVDFELDGVGSIDALELTAKNGVCKMAGVGTIFCDVAEDLDARMTGVGSIKYKNKPAALKKRVSGVGKIRMD